MKVSSRSQYAAKAMLELSLNPEKPLTLSSLAQSQGISISYLEQIFALLRKERLVKSTRGPGGGYSLGKPLEEISIGDIVQAINKGTSGKKKEVQTNDERQELWDELSEIVNTHLSSVTLAQVHNAHNADDQTADEAAPLNKSA
ncbi:MAG: Rrf2 family transcriptional regulator [Thioalkalispiraceae bacterium]|jgi:Rrf2 family iron-sulfur cluster assembly transcriptional regulator